MMKRLLQGVAVALFLALATVPVLAAPSVQGGGDVDFGSYTLESGNRVTGDLVVFGGPVELRSDSRFSGDLTVFGQVIIQEDARLDGQLVVFGSADIAGYIEGDVFSVDSIVIRDTAHIGGNVSAAGPVDREAGAIIEGDLKPMTEGNWQWPEGITIPGPFTSPGVSVPQVVVNHTPRWVTFLWNVIRGVASVIVMSLLALVAASLWPTQTERVGRVIEEAPLASFGIGLLTLILVGLAAVLLLITICLSPFAIVGLIVVGVGLLLGWVALGMVLGRRVLTGLLRQTSSTPVAAAVIGTLLITALLEISKVLGALNALLVLLLVPPVAGAVLLTRFGSRPYATRGAVPPSAPRARPPVAPTARPLPVVEVAEAPTSGAETGLEESPTSSPASEAA